MCTSEFYNRPIAANSLEDVHNSMSMFIPALRAAAPKAPATPAKTAAPVIAASPMVTTAPISTTPMQLAKPTLLGR